MGSFSWLKADDATSVKNVAYKKPFKFLIPEKFGGGSIKDHYKDYGYLGGTEDEPKYDMYELLAFWNRPDDVKFDGDFPLLKEIDEYTDYNRGIGIEIGCYDEDIDQLEFPLKLVSASCKESYEQIKKPSYYDPDQGFYSVRR